VTNAANAVGLSFGVVYDHLKAGKAPAKFIEHYKFILNNNALRADFETE